MSIDLSNPLEWNLVYSGSLSSVNDLRLAPVNFITTHHEIIIGIRVSGKPTWRWGGYLTEQIAALPSSTADLFTALVQIHQISPDLSTVSSYRSRSGDSVAVYLSD
jgi:hypothetical protein